MNHAKKKQNQSLKAPGVKSNYKNILFAVLGVAILAVVAVLIIGNMRNNTSDSLDISDSTIIEATGVEHVLIIGDDEWENETPGRADLMILARIDFDSNLVTLVSIPRDTAYSGFSDGSTFKLNEIYKQEGAEGACKAVSSLTGINVTNYVSIGFEGLEKTVDALGGIEVFVPYDVYYTFYTNDYPAEKFSAGTQTVNGWRAMALSRARTSYANYGHPIDDSVRQAVDRYMFVSLMKKVMEEPSQCLTVLKNLAGNVHTNMKFSKIAGMFQKLSSAESIQVYTATTPVLGDTDNSTGYYLIPVDQDKWNVLFTAVEAGEDPSSCEWIVSDVKEPKNLPLFSSFVVTPGKAS